MNAIEPKGAVFEQEATVNDWDEDYYPPLAIALYDRSIPWMLNAMGAKPDDLVLDAGCGPGVHSIRAANYGCRVHAIDLSETMLSHARDRAKAAGVDDKITFRQANLVEFHPEKPYRFVFSWGVIIHVPQVDEALKSLADAVESGGSLALQLVMEGSADFMVERALRAVMGKPLKDREKTDFGTGNWYTMNGERLWVLRFNLRDLDKRMATLGFKRIARRAAEATEHQRRLTGWTRNILLRINDVISRFNILPGLASTQILVYRKINS
ncbi:Methyltransferase domain-containing protein [Cognatiyoonia koreensis]|uniref:Methyltransferase domain-containing protein n=1 Tax=Cognatiyoonia koreensis TaxID=364200 RepID=A0A1I0RT63_9RHOB|nr:class I SAM-dependent methyltransferase [Cognatiyoonia koreensis]SEW44373.1 Methyltransferase domain-containing protein [Cognatiyoonia koreensis]